jgi:hypothetical protein
MGLTDQQKLYMLPNYVLILKDNKIAGIMSCNDFSFSSDSKVFEENGYTLQIVNFDVLYSKGVRIREDIGLKDQHRWMTAQEYMEKFNRYKNDK